VDYSILGTSRIEPLLRRIRNDMAGAGLYVESAKGECNFGQHEIAFRYAEAVATCDNHSIYKTGAKEIAAQEGMSLTFMAKPNAREGNSCHIHLSVRGTGGTPVMAGAGMYVESAKGECNLGQHEIAFRYAEAVATCDNHSIYKTGAKEIADQEGMSITFMAKPNTREGNSCHIHLSVRGLRDASDGAPVMAGDGPYGMSPLGEHFLAGQLAALRELTLCYAPNINSYKRYVPGSFAPTSVRWGPDNRTCALRLVGHGHSLRVENRVPGGDVNPYLAVAAMIAAGLHGIDHELPLEPPMTGNAYTDTTTRVPHTLRDALDLWEKSGLARQAFGADVVEHYANYARVELTAYDAAVTDWELRRGFERL